MSKHLPIILLSTVLVTATPVFAEDSKPQDSPLIQEVETESVQPTIDKQVEDLRKDIIKEIAQLEGTGGTIIQTSLEHDDEQKLQAALDVAKSENNV